MNKKDIYQIIGYHGNYDATVKKNIRKLLKENHPDHGGNPDIFKLINEVKKELETEKVSYHYDKQENNHINDIDYEYCAKKKKELENKKLKYQKELNILKENLRQNIKKYDYLYQDSLDKEMLLYEDNNNDINNLIKIIFINITFLIITIIILIITKKQYLLIIIGYFVIIIIIILKKLFKKINTINKDKNTKLDDYFNTIKEIKVSQKIKKELNNQKIELEKNINKINNDIRFYNNILKRNEKEGNL